MKANTVRLSQVVQECGRPQLFTLWQAPNENPQFRRALRENRVMTLIQEPVGSRKDFGVVGYLKKRNVSFLLFPKSLAQFREKRVIGIKHGLIAEPKTIGARVTVRKAAGRGRDTRASDRKTQPRLTRFLVTVRCSAETELEEQIEAGNKTDARKRAIDAIATQQIDFSQASVSKKVIRIKRL